MTKPPYGHIAGIAKHGTDEELLKNRDEIRWLGRWTDDVHTTLRAIWNCSTVTISPCDDGFYRDVELKLRLTPDEVATLLHLLDEDDR